MRINIYHTNDIHSNYDMLRKVHAYLKQHKTENDFYFDSGDYTDLKSTVVQADKGVSTMELMMSCGLDGMCIGNNEIDMGADSISELAKAGFPLISANVTGNDDKEIPELLTSMVLESCGKRFLILGASPYYNVNLEPDAYNLFFMMGNVKSQDSITCLKRELEKYDGAYDYCIFLSHSGVVVDEMLLQNVKGIDLCLGGHSHTVKTERGYSQSGKGEMLGRVTLEISDTGIEEVESIQIELEDVVNEEFDTILNEKMKKTDEILSVPMEVYEELSFDPLNESELINFICDAMKKDWPCDFAMMHAGIAEGPLFRPVSEKSLIENFPSKLNPTRYYLSGKAIRESIELSFDEEYIQQDGKGPGFRGHILGTLGFSSNVTITGGPHVIKINGKELDDVKNYYVVVDDYLQRGSGYPSLRVDDSEAEFDSRFIRDLVRDHLMDEELFESAKIKRIVN